MIKKLFIETGSQYFKNSEYAFFKMIKEKMFNNDEELKIINVGGKDKLFDDENRTAIERNTEEGGKNIVIFDADGKNNGGGYEKRKKEIEEKREELNLEFDLFLMPNNKDDGCFETILEHCVKDRQPLECFKCFEESIKKYNKQHEKGYYEPSSKLKMYTYADTVKVISKRKKDEDFWQFGNKDYWDFECNYIKPLKDFLRTEIE